MSDSEDILPQQTGRELGLCMLWLRSDEAKKFKKGTIVLLRAGVFYHHFETFEQMKQSGVKISNYLLAHVWY